MHAVLIALLFLALASADEEQIQLAQPDFAIYHTKYVTCQRNIKAPNPAAWKEYTLCRAPYLICAELQGASP